jgi:pyruvate,orthophosphate dikinase
MGKKLGDAQDPLLVSVRSGAKFSMPGMMDTILNLGLNDKSVLGLKAKTGNGRFAKDSYRRFIQMFGNVVLEIDKDKFEHELHAVKQSRKVSADVDLDERAFDEVIERFKKVVQAETGKPFPQDPKDQLRGARDAVFHSWMNPRATTYRKLNDIPHDLGTAVNVQTMVFGNMGETSATGVGFTRNPSTGGKEFYGEFLQNAQGEDVVAGIRTPRPIAELQQVLPAAYKQLREITTRLEKHYKDVQDFEFTIQENTLFMLQTRNGKRTGLAAVNIAVDLVDEGILTKKEALMKVEPQALDQLLHPIFDPKERAKAEIAAKGLPASPGAATGAVVFTADDAVAWSRRGKSVLLVRMETVPTTSTA